MMAIIGMFFQVQLQLGRLMGFHPQAATVQTVFEESTATFVNTETSNFESVVIFMPPTLHCFSKP